MHFILLVAIAVLGVLAVLKKVSSNVAAWVIVALTLIGVLTSPDTGSRLVFVLTALLGPLVAYPATLLWGLTVLPVLHFLRFRTDSHRAQAELTPDDPRHDEVLLKLAGPIREAESLGFHNSGFVIHEGKMTLVNAFLERDDGSVRMFVTTVLSHPQFPTILHCGVELSTGETLVVTNLPHVDPSPSVPGYINLRLPGVSSVSDLVRLTEFVAARSGSIVPVAKDADLVTRSKSRTKARFEAERKAGYWQYDATADVYRPTIKGAYRQFWVSMPPLSWIIDRRERARERELLAAAGITTTPRSDIPRVETEKATWKTWAEAAGIVLFLIGLGVWGPELLAEMSFDSVRRPLPRVDVPENLTVPDAFPDAVRLLEQVVGQPSHQLSGTVDDFPAPTRGVAISMRMDSADAFVAKAQDAFLAKGFYLFRTGERFSGLDTDGLALWPSPDPYEIMKAMDTNGANHGLLVDDVIAWFRNEEPEYTFRFGAIAFDYVGGRLLGGLHDTKGFAFRFYKFCPDLAQSSDFTIRILTRELESSREFYCWWD
jgi:hypothetical protein